MDSRPIGTLSNESISSDNQENTTLQSRSRGQCTARIEAVYLGNAVLQFAQKSAV